MTQHIPVGRETFRFILDQIGTAFEATHDPLDPDDSWDERDRHDSAARLLADALDTAAYAALRPPPVNALCQLTACAMHELAQDGRERIYDLRPSPY